jgi:Domain of unknown function (DUF4375)
MRGRDCIGVTLALALLLGVSACGDDDSEARVREPKSCAREAVPSRSSDRDFRIERPAEEGINLALDVVEGLMAHMGGEDLAQEDEVLAAATLGQRAIYSLNVVDREVNNGGFHQLFSNSSGALTCAAQSGAELIGATAQADILREAAALFPDAAVPEDRDQRNRALDDLPSEADAKLSSLDDRWYDGDRDLEKLMVHYIEEHPEEFFR